MMDSIGNQRQPALALAGDGNVNLPKSNVSTKIDDFADRIQQISGDHKQKIAAFEGRGGGSTKVNQEVSDILENTDSGTLKLSKETLVRDILDTKPKNSPSPMKWIEKGGTIEIDKSKIPPEWIYTNSDGVKVKYANGFPDFKEAGYVDQEINIGEFTTRSKDFRKADSISPKKANATWHHHQDGKTLQEVPTKIHTQFTHRGGFSISKRGKE